MPLLLFALFIVVPIVELYIIIQVGQAIGVWWTILLLIADSVLGTWLMRSQGRAAWGRFNQAMAAGRVPAREILDGALIIFGGAFLLAPGFLTDGIGLFFLLPPTRALARRFLVRVFAGRFMVIGSAWRPPARPADVVDGTAHDVDHDPPRLP
ncbi:MAG TPA: FxsA family protein [Solirubrobacteraceae bacterium]